MYKNRPITCLFVICYQTVKLIQRYFSRLQTCSTTDTASESLTKIFTKTHFIYLYMYISQQEFWGYKPVNFSKYIQI